MVASSRSTTRRIVGGYVFLCCVLAACGEVTRSSPDGDRQTSAGAGDGAPGAGGCACKIQGDVCSAGGCITPGRKCDALDPCPEGYECYQWSADPEERTCGCADPLLCGIACKSSSDCPPELECDVGAGVCRLALSCFSDVNCAPGQVCLADDVAWAAVCKVPGSKAAGDACEARSECASGLCVTGVCVSACLSTGDCPSGLTCTAVFDYQTNGPQNGSMALACTADSECGSCPADMRCALGECGKGCDTTADCDGETCVVDMQEVNECTPVEYGCAPSEALLLADEYSDAGDHCITNTICWSDDACSPPYQCVDVYSVSFEDAETMGGTAQVCARPVPAGSGAP